MSTSMVASDRPRFRWHLPNSIAEVELQICADRACKQDVRSAVVRGTEHRWTSPLRRGPWFWRLRNRVADQPVGDFSVTWQFTVVGTAARDYSTHGVPDVNGDGLADLIVGVPLANAGQGRVLIYSGDSLDSPRWTLDPPTGAGGGFGSVVSCVGDLNGDGFAELAVSSSVDANPAGVVTLYWGSATGPTTETAIVLRGASSDERFGVSLERAGDLNGDGYADWVVTSLGGTWPTWLGGVWPIYGSAPGGTVRQSQVWRVLRSEYQFGRFVAAADLDDDGHTDLVAGGVWRGASGPAKVTSRPGFIATAQGGSQGLDLPGARQLDARAFENGFGGTGGFLGDRNGDGFPDLLVGVPNVNEVAYLLPSRPGGYMLPGIASWPRGTGSNTSGILYRAGDLNQDGHEDWIRDLRTIQGLQSVPVGVQVVVSTELGVNMLSDEGLRFPHGTVAAMADYTGDNFADLVIGDPTADSGAGVVHIFAGRVGGPSTTPTRTIRAPGAAPMGFGAALAR
ncbi:MAG: VCBS repeat-containing protein [Polyangiales bacterium]